MLDKKKQIDYYIQALFVYGPIAQLVRAPACHAGGRRFEPVLGRQNSCFSNEKQELFFAHFAFICELCVKLLRFVEFRVIMC